MKVRTVTQLLVIIAMAGLLVGCRQSQCASKNPCVGISAEIKQAETPVTDTVPPLPPDEPKTAETPAAEPAKEAAKAKGKLIVVTNEANYEKDKDILNFISTRGVTIERITLADFEKYKTEKSILILGGPNDSDGLGDIVKQTLSPDEANFVSQTGNKNLYLKANKWGDGQNVLIVAGYDTDATFRELVNSKDKWWGYISSWFNIELSHDEVYGY